MTRTLWPRASAAWRSRDVEYKFALRERRASFIGSHERSDDRGVEIHLRRGGDCTAPAQEGTCRIDDKPAPDRLPPQQHAEPHLISARQGQLDAEALVTQHDRRADHRPDLERPVARP